MQVTPPQRRRGRLLCSFFLLCLAGKRNSVSPLKEMRPLCPQQRHFFDSGEYEVAKSQHADQMAQRIAERPHLFDRVSPTTSPSHSPEHSPRGGEFREKEPAGEKDAE